MYFFHQIYITKEIPNKVTISKQIRRHKVTSTCKLVPKMEKSCDVRFYDNLNTKCRYDDHIYIYMFKIYV